MKVEKHNSHGLHLYVTLTENERANILYLLTHSNMLSVPCKFEDDNNRWEDCEFTVVVEQ